MTRTRGEGTTAAVLGILVFAIFNANGREIGSFDSQPTKYAAREFLLRRTLALNHVVGQAPALMDRSGFQLASDGRYRSAYSPVPALSAAVLVWPLWKIGAIDVRAPLAPALISALSSSTLVTLAVVLAFFTARMQLSRSRAVVVALAFGVGTGLWSTVSQTLWQHETSVFGLAVAVLGLSAIASREGNRTQGTVLMGAVAVGLALGLAGGSRPQLAPAVMALLVGTFVVAGWRAALVCALAAATIIVPVCLANVRWFGHPLGAAPMLEALHESLHGTTGSFSLSSGGYAGLLMSPNRGLFVFSPVVLFAAAGLPALARSHWRSPLLWCTLAAVFQFILYASYVVWWGGHTYGPRYMLDILPLLLPLGIVAMHELRGRVLPAVAAAALAWSIGVAAIGAFCHPHGRWNNEPIDVDRAHDRLWEWRDTQILRTYRAGLSPQNFSLLSRDAIRTPLP